MKETEKQLEYIRFIEDETGIIYKGKTKQEASINMWALVNGY